MTTVVHGDPAKVRDIALSTDGYYACEVCGTPTGLYSTRCDNHPLSQDELRAMAREIMEKSRVLSHATLRSRLNDANN